jgi:hypothetical protein
MPPDAPATYVNVHGRRPTRGLRPWLLIPKVLAVGAVLGMMLAMILATNAAHDFAQAGQGEGAAEYLWLVRRLFHLFIERGIGIAALLGILLFLQHRAVFLRQRWWQAKMAALACSGALSLWLAPRMGELNPASTPGAWKLVAAGQWGLIGLTICVIVLGRLKPRLGQRPTPPGTPRNRRKPRSDPDPGARNRPLTRRTRLWLLLTLAACLAGCATPYHDPRILASAVPGDFALQISVRGPDGSAFISRQPAQYVVECNRNLRVALGSGATGRYFPKLTGVLTHEQYEAVYRQVADHDLLHATGGAQTRAAEDGTPGNQVVYQVQIIADGRVHDWSTTPEESPDVTHLLAMLARMSGRQPAATAPAPTSQETAP